MTKESGGTSRLALLGRIARYGIAAGILWLVARSVPWSDRLDFQARGAPTASVLMGEIAGSWNAPEIDFTIRSLPQPSAPAAAGSVPDELAQAVRAARLGLGTRLHLTAERLSWELDGQRLAIEGQAHWRPGMPNAFRQLELRELLPALGFLVLGSIFAITRWWRLLALIGCGARFVDALRLTYIGLCFNLIVPGLNGGDVARGVLIVRENPERRADALMSVFVDRLLGLLAMIALAVAATYAVGEPLRELRLPVSLTLLAAVLGLTLLLNPHVRRWTRFERLLARLPQGERLQRLDDALVEYARHPGQVALALLLSVGNHASVTAAILSLGRAFGDQLDAVSYLATVTVTNTLTSLPISPGGWGWGEASFRTFFVQLGSVATIGVAVSVTYRLLNAALGLAGGLFLLLPGGRAVRAHLAEETTSEAAAD